MTNLFSKYSKRNTSNMKLNSGDNSNNLQAEEMNFYINSLSTEKDADTMGNNLIDKDPIIEVLNRFYQIYSEHGVSIQQMPSFIDSKFDIQFSDLSPKENLLNKLNDELIYWTCEKFGVLREWVDNGSTSIYRYTECYKALFNFTELLSDLIDKIGVYNNYKSKIRVYALKHVEELKANFTKENSHVLFLVQVNIGKVSTDWVYKYIPIKDEFLWDYEKSRYYAKKMIALCKGFGIYVDGYDLPYEVLSNLCYNRFPDNIIKGLHSYSWYPEDYIEYTGRIHELEREENRYYGDELDNAEKEAREIINQKEEQFHYNMKYKSESSE